MDVNTHIKADPPALVDYIRLPDEIVTGRFGNAGKPSDDPVSLYITVKDTSFMWGVFSYKLEAGQRGEMIFTNVPGTFLVGICFNEWDTDSNEPKLSEGLLTLVSAQRGEGVFRVIGKNASDHAVYAAVGITVADDASYQPVLPKAKQVTW
ncbi:MAG TPA: hypothetical protein VG759_20130 [Candidatus Angelobacter sp.]|nr:hypothetical protein [Candidatus Angelobacter sp.]